MKKGIDFKKMGVTIKDTFKKIGKKNFIVILSILVIGGAVYINYLLFSDPIDAIGYGANNMEDTYEASNGNNYSSENNNDTYFSTTILSRQKARDEALSVLQTVVESAEALEETRNQAFADISQIASDIEREANIESLIEAKGFEDCVAVINGNVANIIVKTDGLLANDIAQINEIVYEQAGVLPVDVRIVERAK